MRKPDKGIEIINSTQFACSFTDEAALSVQSVYKAVELFNPKLGLANTKCTQSH
jgi:hypothetical protein